jgi:hypothetical protein
MDARSRKLHDIEKQSIIEELTEAKMLIESLEEMENLPEPDVIASEIVENLEFALEQFKGIVEDLENKE